MRRKLLRALALIVFLTVGIFYTYEVTFFKSYVPAKLGALSTIAICNTGWVLGGWGYAVFRFDEAPGAAIEKGGITYLADVRKTMRLPQLPGGDAREITYDHWRPIEPRDIGDGLPVAFPCKGGLSNNDSQRLLQALDTSGGYVSASSNAHGALYVVPKLRWVFYTYMDR